MFASARSGAAALLCVLVAAGLAQPARGEAPQAGSVLVFPLFDSAPGNGTVICLTNTETSQLRCSDDHLEGDVVLHYVYFDGDTWQEFDRFEQLTPGDTLCVVADEHNPEGVSGFLVVIALDPVTLQPLFFNHVVGQAIVVQSGLNFSWSYTPFSFLAQPTAGDPCDRPNPDAALGDGDGVADFDGVEYEAFPRELVVPTFFEEDDRFGNQLTLMSTAGGFYRNEIRLLLYNNIENPFSRTQTFTCWFSAPLSEISGAAANLQGDPDELGHDTQTGWVSIRGRTLRDLAGNVVRHTGGGDPVIPPILGVFMQLVRGTDFAMGDALYGRDGTTNGLELPHGNRDLDP